MIPLLVILGATIGAPLRHLAGRWNGRTPWGTFAVNVAGSFVLGIVTGAVASPAVVALVGIGFCGTLTTYSTFALETVELTAAGRRVPAVLYALGSVVAGLAAAGLGLAAAPLVRG